MPFALNSFNRKGGILHLPVGVLWSCPARPTCFQPNLICDGIHLYIQTLLYGQWEIQEIRVTLEPGVPDIYVAAPLFIQILDGGNEVDAAFCTVKDAWGQILFT
jgi:hypothetical protein